MGNEVAVQAISRDVVNPHWLNNFIFYGLEGWSLHAGHLHFFWSYRFYFENEKGVLGENCIIKILCMVRESSERR